MIERHFDRLINYNYTKNKSNTLCISRGLGPNEGTPQVNGGIVHNDAFRYTQPSEYPNMGHDCRSHPEGAGGTESPQEAQSAGKSTNR